MKGLALTYVLGPSLVPRLKLHILVYAMYLCMYDSSSRNPIFLLYLVRMRKRLFSRYGKKV